MTSFASWPAWPPSCSPPPSPASGVRVCFSTGPVISEVHWPPPSLLAFWANEMEISISISACSDHHFQSNGALASNSGNSTVKWSLLWFEVLVTWNDSKRSGVPFAVTRPSGRRTCDWTLDDRLASRVELRRDQQSHGPLNPRVGQAVQHRDPIPLRRVAEFVERDAEQVAADDAERLLRRRREHAAVDEGDPGHHTAPASRLIAMRLR